MYFSPTALSFYSSSVSVDCVEVSDELHNTIMDGVKEGQILSLDNNNQPILLPAPPVSPTDQLLARIEILNTEYEKATAVMRGTFPPSESDTWTTQREQAIAYQIWKENGMTGPRPLIPFLDELNDYRTANGIPGGMDYLVSRIFANNDIYSPALADLTARRHAAEISMWTLLQGGDLASALAVTWDFTLPASPV